MCGLVGFVPNRKSEIDILRFKTLLLYNENRGKLSTGIYNKNGLKKDIISAWAFSEKQNWNGLDKNSIFIGHTRQPTVGYPVTMHGAQPIEIGNIVMIHNGTIYNKEELAKKYKVKLDKDDTDSIIIAKILETKQFEVLNDYNGAAALVWVYKDEPDNLYYYRGESKVLYTSFDLKSERPLFQMRTKEGIYFSSIDNSLNHISLSVKQIESIKEVEANKVFKLNINRINKPLVMFTSVSERIQTKEYTYPITTHSSYKTNTTLYEKRQEARKARRQAQMKLEYGNDTVEGYVEDENGIYIPETTVDDKEKNKTVTLNKMNTQDDHDFKYIYDTPSFLNIEDEEINRKMINPNMVYYNKGRYWINNVPANGKFSLDVSGVVSPKGTTYGFISGILLKDKSTKYWSTIIANINTRGHFFGSISFASLLCKHSIQPIPYYSYFTNSILVYGEKGVALNGIYYPLFLTRGNYEFTDGEYVALYNKIVSVGDMVITKFKEYVIVTSVNDTGFRGYLIEDTVREITNYATSWVLDVIPQTEGKDEDEVPTLDEKDLELLEEVNDITDIALELVTHLNEASHKLGFYKNNKEAISLLELVADFKENKLAM